jgi:hypothetical protein
MDFDLLGPLTGAQLAHLLATGAIRPDETLFLSRRPVRVAPSLQEIVGALGKLQPLVQRVHRLALENRHRALELEQLGSPNEHADEDTLDVAFEGAPSGPASSGPSAA